MTEQELRVLVRQAIARAQGAQHAPPHIAPSDAPSHFARLGPSHASHALFLVPDGSDAAGPCIIEPAVPCNHCGYCKSMGH
jgi:hypothetical protein